MRLFPLSAFQVCFSAGVLLSLVQSAQPKGQPGALQVKTNTDYPEILKSVPELCFVVAKIIFKRMSEFNEKLQASDLDIYDGEYVDENNKLLHISVEDYMNLMGKLVLFNDMEDTLYNVLTNVTFFELLKLNRKMCSPEVLLIARIVGLLCLFDNGVGHMIYRMAEEGTKVNLTLLSEAVAQGQVVCDMKFLDAINDFGKLYVKDWKNVKFEDEKRGSTVGTSSTSKGFARMERIRNFSILNEEKSCLGIASRFPCMFLIHSLFPILRREMKWVASHCSYRYMIQSETILAKLPRELIREIINSARIKELEASHSLKTTYSDLCVEDQKLFKKKILSKFPSIEKALGSEELDLKQVRSRDDNFSIINSSLNSGSLRYRIEIFDKQLYFKELPNEQNEAHVFIRKREGKYEIFRYKLGEALYFDLEGGDEIFLGILSDYVNDKYLDRMLGSCPPEMMNFQLYNLGFDHWMIISNF